MKISVIIPTKNRFEDLIITLKSICQNNILPFEVIIVDQSPINIEKKLIYLLKKWNCNLQIKYFHRPDITSLVEARNYGVYQSSGEIIQFLDDDITVMPDFFEKLEELYTNNSHVDALCAVDISEDSLSLWRLILRLIFWRGPFYDNRSLANKFHKRFKDLIKTQSFSAGLMSCRKKVFEDIGFDPKLKGHVFVGDIDFSFRASQKYNLYLAPQLKAVHRGGQIQHYNIEEGERKRVHGRIYFFRKNVPKNVKNYIAFAWLMIGTFLGTISRCIIYKSLKPLKGFLKGLKDAQKI